MTNLCLSADQQREFQQNGFLVFEDLLTPDEVDRYLQIIDRLDHACPTTHGGAARKPGEHLELRNAVAHEPALLDLLTHERLFPAIIDLMGHNICMTTSHAFLRPLRPPARSATSRRSGGTRTARCPSGRRR